MYQTPKMFPYGGMGESYDLIMKVRPLIDYALKEAEYKSVKHAITEASLIAYLMGMGYSMQRAHQMVESMEINESFQQM